MIQTSLVILGLVAASLGTAAQPDSAPSDDLRDRSLAALTYSKPEGLHRSHPPKLSDDLRRRSLAALTHPLSPLHRRMPAPQLSEDLAERSLAALTMQATRRANR